MGNKCCFEINQQHSNPSRREILLEPSHLTETDSEIDLNDSRPAFSCQNNNNSIRNNSSSSRLSFNHKFSKKLDITTSEQCTPKSSGNIKHMSQAKSSNHIEALPPNSPSQPQRLAAFSNGRNIQQLEPSQQLPQLPQLLSGTEIQQANQVSSAEKIQFEALFRIIEQMQSTSMRELSLSIPSASYLQTDKIYKLRESGDYYVGGFNLQNQREGFGRFFGTRGIYYEGEWKDDCFNGKGIYVEQDHLCLKGTFRNNLPNGNCIYVKLKRRSTLDFFEEEEDINDDRQQQFKKEGSAGLLGSDYTSTKLVECRYKGEMEEGKKHGNGELLIDNVLRYVGCFSHDRFDGYGICQYNSGQIYEGHWQKDKRQGTGKELWPDGSSYQGEYKDDKFDGYGQLIKENGDMYEGFWKNGLMDGQGVWKEKQGNSIYGEWIGGVLQEKNSVHNNSNNKTKINTSDTTNVNSSTVGKYLP